MTFKIPEFLQEKLTDKTCPSHNKKLFFIDGKLMCPECRLLKAEMNYQEKIKSNMDDDRLDEYNREKRAKKEKK